MVPLSQSSERGPSAELSEVMNVSGASLFVSNDIKGEATKKELSFVIQFVNISGLCYILP